MSILRLDLIDSEPSRIDLVRLDEAVLDLPDGLPVTFLVHGFRYEPGHRSNDPHRHIYSADAGGLGRSLSWVRHLGFRGSEASTGLIVAMGWNARGSIWSAYRASEFAGCALARLVERIAVVSPGRRVTAIAHSLGARVVLQSLLSLRTSTINRAVLMSAAAFRNETLAAVSSPAGRRCEFVNVTSRENDLFDLCMELLVGAGLRPSIGLGIGSNVANWIDVQLDDERVLQSLRELGFHVEPEPRRICHWSTFRRPGIFKLYRSLLCERDPLPLEVLAARLPRGQSARWSRLLAPLQKPIMVKGFQVR